MAGRRHAAAGAAAACLAALLLVAVAVPSVTSAALDCERNPNHRDCQSPSPSREVLVEVRLADPDSSQQEDEDEPTSSSAARTTDDAAQRVLADASGSTQAPGERWDPPWLAWLTGLAVVLVGLAMAWWLFLVVRVQDRWDG